MPKNFVWRGLCVCVLAGICAEPFCVYEYMPREVYVSNIVKSLEDSNGENRLAVLRLSR